MITPSALFPGSVLLDRASIVLYAIGALGGVLLAHQMLRMRHSYAKTLFVANAGWVVMSLIWLYSLVHKIVGGGSPSYAPWLFLLNAVILAAAPVIQLVWWARIDGRERS